MKTIGANSAESTEGVITNKQKGRDKPKLIPLTKIKYNPPQRYLFHSPKRKTKLQPETCTNLTTNQLFAKRQQFPDNCKGHDGKDGHHHGQEKNKGHNIQQQANQKRTSNSTISPTRFDPATPQWTYD